MKIHIVIPARFASGRLPGKVLADIHGKPMLQHVYERALEAQVDSIMIATDDERVVAAANSFQAPVCMTSPTHLTGTDRLAEVIEKMHYAIGDIVVNLQGDEPFLPGKIIRQVADSLKEHLTSNVATLCKAIHIKADIFDPNIVKVVRNKQGYALYFSRAPIPWLRDGWENTEKLGKDFNIYRHIGLYAYRAEFVKRYINLKPSLLERAESLEQLRVLDYGEKIYVVETNEAVGMGVDTPEDLEKVRNYQFTGA